MNNDEKLILNLNKLFKSKKFISTLMEDEIQFSPRIFEKMGIVLDYYIATRDNNINYTYKQIEEKFKELDFESLKDNIIANGFMTHSFNGYKKEMVDRKGLDYMKSATEQERKQISDRRASLNELEDILGKSRFVADEASREESQRKDKVFLCTPGAKTFYYACKRSPERLYEGPLQGSDFESIIVGESKSNYLLRILENKIKDKYKDGNIEQINHAMEVAKKVVENYATDTPAIAMIKINQINDLSSSNAQIKDSEALSDRINRAIDYDTQNFFSKNPNDYIEPNNLGDLVVMSENIPKSAILTIECMDEFEMQQLFAISKGIKVGEFIDYTPEKSLGRPTIDMIKSVIKDIKDPILLSELRENYELIKSESIKQIEEESEKLMGKYTESSLEQIKENLLRRKEELLSKRDNILDSEYPKKEGINTDYTLRNALEDIESNGLKKHLLETDMKIKEDSLQYQSDLHGVSHTRRVNFYATLIMNSENISDSSKSLIETIIQNHDIGRTNDAEDKEHGAKSVELLKKNDDRLKDLSDEEKELVEFVIKEHSLSARENESDIEEVFQRKIEEDFSKHSRMLKTDEMKNRFSQQQLKVFGLKKNNWHNIMDICKDSDKLDRIRLDPRGEYPREGLNVNRLSLESSKKLENVAYESLTKIIPILDIEREVQCIDTDIEKIDNLLMLKEEVLKGEEVEQELESAEKNISGRKKEFLKKVTSQKRFSKIKNMVETLRNVFKPKENTQEK